jgi:hypothetical protein
MLGSARLDLAGGCEAVHVRHGVIDDYDVRQQLGRTGDCFPPVNRRAADSKSGFSA